MPEDTNSQIHNPEGLIASLTNSDKTNKHRVTFDIAPAAIYRIGAAIAVVWLLIRIFPVIILVVLSLMLVAAFNPVVRKLQARLGRPGAIAAIISLIVVVFLGTLALLIPPLMSQGELIVHNAPHYAHQIQDTFSAHGIHVNILKQVEALTGKPAGASSQLVGVLSGAIGLIASFVTVAILTIYLLIEGPEFGTSVLRLLPRKERLSFRRLVMEIGEQVGGYMRGQMITSGLAGLFSFTTCLLLGIPNPLALGALAAIADAIPMIGLLIALVPAAIMALTISPSKAGIVVAVYLIYHQIEDHFIAPKVYGKALGLSLSIIVISILVGAELMGMLGAVLALPVAAAIPSLIKFIQEWQESQGASDSEAPKLP